MNLNKLTIKSQEALAEAQDSASQQGHAEILPIHILLALITQEQGAVVSVLNRIGGSIEELIEQINTTLERYPRVSGGASAMPTLGTAAHKTLDAGWKAAQECR